MTVLITGGAGFIGSHTALALLERGYDIVVLDNFTNSSHKSLTRVKTITGINFDVHEGDVRDKNKLRDIFSRYAISDVIHFAGLKSVSESIKNPLEYYDVNVVGVLCLLEEMKLAHVKSIIFSSSATVYGLPSNIPLNECESTGNTLNPYGTSKYISERILKDLSLSHPDFNVTILRYFNPVGAHPSGLIGEDPHGVPTNLLPYITQVAIGNLEQLSVYGNDYPTKDGTGVRDYIHVMDLASGHIAAIENKQRNLYNVYNLGTGKGFSVLDIINSFKKVTGIKINYKFEPRRPGDAPECWADPSLAKSELDWVATRDLEEMIRDSWNWQTLNPNGYECNY
ncbi:UDP-glucose 4-epimerase GalE [Symbiopectobacterium purcellii]|uniref:UDP-glucose 4-epimerase n=1 Tax=Symbiopectobacterium purcellii TaxID=2871826 RepID=A0ABX9APG3_9ENTR|nr:UDP-glucose 4-epimerase GalE [Symbiopectobacterium purcellii]QZN97075.1 UDP-glucose 4-epimerase GalE [Symbiopectobacterium purcellii]